MGTFLNVQCTEFCTTLCAAHCTAKSSAHCNTTAHHEYKIIESVDLHIPATC